MMLLSRVFAINNLFAINFFCLFFIISKARVGSLEDSNRLLKVKAEENSENIVFPEDFFVDDDEGCRTPDRGVGRCITIKDCQPMVDFLLSIPRPISQTNSQLIRSYHCGYERGTVKVCCPPAPITSGGRETTVTERFPEPPDVSNHRNIPLINSDVCGLANTLDRIINGNATSLFDFPWMALLSYRIRNTRDFRCGGSLINNKYVLTAAHCITNLGSKSLIGVRLGEHNINTREDCEDFQGTVICAPPVQDYAIERLIPHPDYSTTDFTNDIGLIKLRGEANLDVENVKPICLPTTRTLRRVDLTKTNGTVTGWGVTETGVRSAELLQVLLPVFDYSQCKTAYSKTSYPITYKQMCAGGKNQRDSCGGDSGGPLQVSAFLNNDVRFVQHGIVSFGPRRCGQEGFPGVYTKVAYYMDWILNTITS